MDIYVNRRKVAFTAFGPGYLPWGFPKVGDVQVWEETSVGLCDDDPPEKQIFKHTASFINTKDALAYLEAKYPERERGCSTNESGGSVWYKFKD